MAFIPWIIILLSCCQWTICSTTANFTLPLKEYELRRMQGQRSIYEEWRSLKNQLIRTQSAGKLHNPTMFKELLAKMREHYIEIMAHMNLLRQKDGLDSTRAQANEKLRAIVQAKLHQMQNPPDCSSAKILICEPGKKRANGAPDCGWGCLVNHLTLCFAYAFASHRMLMFDPKSFGLHSFKPYSDSCEMKHLPATSINWPSEEARVVKFMPYANNVDTGAYENVVFPTLPADLMEVLPYVTPDPEAWFVGQFVAYILRPKQQDFHLGTKRLPGFFAGLHIRRTDKSKEATFVDTQVYLEIIEEFFDICSAEGWPKMDKNVLLATDDVQVLKAINAEQKRPDWNILSNTTSIELGTDEKLRYTMEGQDAIARDVLRLARADFLVCTFSSNVCRVAYALRTATKSFVSHLHEVVSLDSDWFILQEFTKTYKARHARNPKKSDELQFNSDDIIVTKKTRFWNLEPANVGFKKSKANLKKHYLRAALDRIYPTSRLYPSFF